MTILRRYWPHAVLVGLLILMHDFWWWNDASQLFGLPIGLAYHVVFTFVCSLMFALIVKTNWPFEDEGGKAS